MKRMRMMKKKRTTVMCHRINNGRHDAVGELFDFGKAVMSDVAVAGVVAHSSLTT